MPNRFRVFITIFISMGVGFAISFLMTINSNPPLSLTAIIFFITALIASLISNSFIYKNISTLEDLTSQIAKGSAKKKFIKALKDDSSDYRNVATSISEISESLKKNINLIGWILFIISALGFIISSVGSFWAMFGSLFFLIACIVFLIPFFRKDESEK
mgnify:CR=1 FL=1